jgi:hypothetical protein
VSTYQFEVNMVDDSAHQAQWEEAFCGDNTPIDWLVNGTFGQDIGPCFRGLVFRGPPAVYAFIFCSLAWFRAGRVGAATSVIDVGAFGFLDSIRVLLVALLAVAPLVVGAAIGETHGLGSSPHEIADGLLVVIPFVVVLLVGKDSRAVDSIVSIFAWEQ